MGKIRNSKSVEEMKKYITAVVLVIVGAFATSCGLMAVINKIAERNVNLLRQKEVYILFLCLAVLFGIGILLKYKKGYSKRITRLLLKGKKEDDEISGNLESVHFQTDDEIEQNFTTATFGNPITKGGVVIKAEETDGDYVINMAENSHVLVIGSTGSGKTTNYIDPNIQILSEYKEKPSMLITDPKGELYQKHKDSLEKKGYKVEVIDLRNPYTSKKWNPLEEIYVDYDIASNMYRYVEKKGDKYFLFGKEYSEAELQNAMRIEQQKRYDDVYERLNDVAAILCPVTSKSEPLWESGAKNLILATLLAMLEDSQDEERKLRKEQYNFYNLFKILSSTDNNCRALVEYFSSRNILSKARALSKQTLESHERTRGSYLSTLFDKINIFTDLSICHLTSESEIDFAEMDEKPYAVFVQIPDEKDTRHKIASMVILSAYKQLISKASVNTSLKLKRNVYFILDEFGNLPKIEKIEQMATVSRSRGIFITFVVQSYSQLTKVYDKNIADIVKANCNVHVFIGTSDLATTEEFSKRCGNYSTLSRSISESVNGGKDPTNNVSVKERPLIYPSELRTLNSGDNVGNAIVTIFGYNPIKSKFTPSYKCTKFSLKSREEGKTFKKLFDEEKVIYDITTLAKNKEKTTRKENRIVEEIEEETMSVEEIKNKVHEIISVELLAPEDMKLLATLIETKNREKIIMCLKDFIEFAKRIDKEYLATAIIELIEEIEEKEIE